MKRRLLYITVLASVMLASCAKEKRWEQTLSETGEKTPLEVGLALQAGGGSVSTKAADMDFATGDTFVAYLRHVTWNEAVDGARGNVAADQAPQLVTFTKGSTSMAQYTGPDITPIGTGVALGMLSSNTKIATDFVPDHALYWDDFSNSSSADTDLRTEGHYLESYYGYCYNGGTPSTDLVQADGTLGWTVATNQSTGFQTSDLLWSAEQTPIRYIPAKETRKGLLIPFTHAMSKVTISIVCDTGNGFSSGVDNFSGASVVLKNMNTVCSLSAPTASVTATGTPADITMRPNEGATNITKSFSALIPKNTFSNGLDFAAINNVDGNNYKLVLTDAMMRTADEHDADWASKLTDYTEGTKSGTTQPGVHYMITVTIAKQGITVKATIQNWEDVTAEGVGIIQFVGDITEKGTIQSELQTNGFAIYQAANTSPINYTQTSVWNYADSKWTATPQIYWPNGADKFYFRALSGYNDAVGEDLTMELGRDVLWATTSAHSGPEAENPTWNYAIGDPIAPRTGDVPLAFEHPMSKITVNLETVTGDAAVTLAGAHISIANIYDGGTIDLHDGSIGSLTASTEIPVRDYLAANDATSGTKLSHVVVIPQSLTTMNDGTTPRDGAVSFYNAGELTEVDGHTYVTSTLGVVNYTEEEANTYNATLEGYKTTSDVKTPAVLYTEETAAAYNATLDGAVESGDPIFYTHEEFRALTNAQMTEVLFALLTDEQKKHECTSFTEYKELTGSVITEEEFNNLSDEQKTITYTLEQYIAITPTFCPFVSLPEADFNSLSEEARTRDVYTEETAKTHNAGLTGAVSAGQVQTEAVYYTQDEANAYNATLPGAVHEGDFKEYNASSATQKNAGDIKTNEANPKIMMLIRLADETTYVLNLATCKAYTVDGEGNRIEGETITAWERGKHYTYTISLSKEAITFRALIKDWVETSGGGNANLDWD